MSFFLVVRGPLGAGKTTIARAIAIAVSAEVVSVDEIVDREEWDGGSEALFLRANEVVAERARPVLARGRPVVVDGNFYWASALDDLARRLPFPHEVFTLRVPLEVCIERDRLRSRSYGAEATREVYAKVSGADRGFAIDGTRPVGEVVEAMRARLRSRHLGARRPSPRAKGRPARSA